MSTKERPGTVFNGIDLDTLLKALSEGGGDGPIKTSDGKDLGAVLLGRMGGLKGGRARAQSLSSERRSEIARAAAKKRWEKRDE